MTNRKMNPYVMSKQASYARVCPACGNTFVTHISTKVYCDRQCAKNDWGKSHKRNERMITEKMVREAEGLDKPKVKHVCDTSRFGYCVPCRLQAMRQRRETVPTMTAAQGATD